jgi:predicted Zn-dependent protease
MKTLIICFLFGITPVMAQLDGVSEEQLQMESLYIEALGHGMVGEYEEAISKMEKFSSKEPTEFAPFYQMAKWYFRTDNLTEALIQIEKARTLEPNQPEVLRLKMKLLKENNQLDAAADVAKDLWQLTPASTNAALLPAKLYIEAGNPNGADEWLAKVEENMPVNGLAMARIIELRVMTALSVRDFELAEEKVMLLLEQRPGNLKYLHLLARTYRAQDQEENEIRVLKKVVETHPDEWKAQVRLAHLEADGDVVAYLDIITSLLKEKEIDISVEDRISLLTEELQGYPLKLRRERAALYQAAHQLYENSSESAAVQALFIEAANYHGQWNEVLDIIFTDLEAEKTATSAETWLRYMKMLSQARYYKASISAGERVLLEYPNSGEVYVALAYAYFKMGDSDESEYYLKSGSRLIRGNEYLKERAAVIEGLMAKDRNPQSKWEELSGGVLASASAADPLNLLLYLENSDSNRSEFFREVTQLQTEERFTYLLSLVKAWAFFRLDQKDQALEELDACMDRGCYTHPSTYILQYKIAEDQGLLEKAAQIKTQVEELGVQWEQ